MYNQIASSSTPGKAKYFDIICCNHKGYAATTTTGLVCLCNLSELIADSLLHFMLLHSEKIICRARHLVTIFIHTWFIGDGMKVPLKLMIRPITRFQLLRNPTDL